MVDPVIVYKGVEEIDESGVDEIISRTPLKGQSISGIMKGVELVWDTIKKGAPARSCEVPLENMGFPEESRRVLVDIAVTRRRAVRKYSHGRSMFFTSAGLRWATPESAASYCAGRLGRKMVMDVTCGQGGQLLYLSETCSRVIGVDVDPLNCLVSLMNCISTGKNNVTVVNGDCMEPEVISLAEEGCAVFCDPARPSGSRERSFEEIEPDPRDIMGAYDDIAGGICFEIPPYMSMDKVDMECEAEYISIDGRINRLNLYTGDLIRARRSALVLPSGSSIFGTPGKGVNEFRETMLSPGSILHEVDPSVVRADLENSLAETLEVSPNFIHLDGRRCMLQTSGDVHSSFLKYTYRVLATGIQRDNLIPIMRRLGVGSVTLRFGVDPGEYWKVRNSLESRLDGNRKVQLFRGDSYMILEKIDGGVP